jgi:hypothetical protein
MEPASQRYRKYIVETAFEKNYATTPLFGI